MFNKTIVVLKNKLMMLSNNDLVYKCLDSNYLISSLAREELVRRHPISLDIEDTILTSIIDKLSIEQIYELVTSNVDSKLSSLAILKLKKIFDYYDKVNGIDSQKDKIYLLK